MTDPASVLPLFGLRSIDYGVERVGSGHIHHTFKLTGSPCYILQRVNKNVFRNPEIIAENLRQASRYLGATVPDFHFLTPVASISGREMEIDPEGYPWRLFPYIENTITIDSVENAQQAAEASAEFARLTRHLDNVDRNLFQATIPRFHDLTLRKEQFEEALRGGGERLEKAKHEIQLAKSFYPLVDRYRSLSESGALRLRIVHNDTKINNVLFAKHTGKTVAVIDLDTLMPGYFIYDLGDMVRTFVSPVSEEEGDLSKIFFRKEVYDALIKGYLSEMGAVMTDKEKEAIPFSGKMMTYIMALRFLADYLRGDTYYHITYPEQNRVRAANQLRLLQVLEENIPEHQSKGT